MAQVDHRPSLGSERECESSEQFVHPEPEGAGSPLWDRHWALLYPDLVRYVAQLSVGDTFLAEDVVQETAIRLWRHAETVDRQRPLGGWLRTVARNIVIDMARRRSARPAEIALAPGVDMESDDRFETVDSFAAVASMLSGLSPRHRDVVFEVYVRDRPVAVVAAELGLPEGTVKSRCHVALARLRTQLLSEVRTCA